jgi:hypothetical protein
MEAGRQTENGAEETIAHSAVKRAVTLVPYIGIGRRFRLLSCRTIEKREKG